jgi:hypothetical protein
VIGFLQTWLLDFRPKSSILVSSDQGILFLMANPKAGCHVPFLLRSCFRLATLP